mmetsp:Transcript_45641/g.90576  ORF Transcript_45641/g.90576 Transcript_45641/m.90576 type:complete len:135 (+) Transcript_45641:116-520(+)
MSSTPCTVIIPNPVQKKNLLVHRDGCFGGQFGPRRRGVEVPRTAVEVPRTTEGPTVGDPPLKRMISSPGEYTVACAVCSVARFWTVPGGGVPAFSIPAGPDAKRGARNATEAVAAVTAVELPNGRDKVAKFLPP